MLEVQQVNLRAFHEIVENGVVANGADARLVETLPWAVGEHRWIKTAAHAVHTCVATGMGPFSKTPRSAGEAREPPWVLFFFSFSVFFDGEGRRDGRFVPTPRHDKSGTERTEH